MKKINLSIVIPTRNRSQLLSKTLQNLKKNSFFFNEIIIIDSSDKNERRKTNNLKKFKNLKLKIINSSPGISKQRNLGLKHVNKKSDYVMFLDDDLIFEEGAIKKMYYFLKLNKNYCGVGFNLIIKNTNNFIESIKKNKLMKSLKIYDNVEGKVTPSGWQTKAINLKKNKTVEWLPTQAVIYSYKKIKEKKFDVNYGSYSYLEDLDFSYNLKDYGLIICSKAKYSSDNIIKRNPFFFGIKEIVNRFYFVKKFNLNKVSFIIGCFFLIAKHLITFFTIKPQYLLRIAGNLFGLLKVIF